MPSICRYFQIAAVALLSVVVISCEKNHDDNRRRDDQPPQNGGFGDYGRGNQGNQPNPGPARGMANGGFNNRPFTNRLKSHNIAAITNGVSETTATAYLPTDAKFAVTSAQLEISKTGDVSVAVKINEANIEKVLVLTGSYAKSEATLTAENAKGTLSCLDEACSSADVSITVGTVEFYLTFSAK